MASPTDLLILDGGLAIELECQFSLDLSTSRLQSGQVLAQNMYFEQLLQTTRINEQKKRKGQ